jgi:hypothetical protein
LRVDPVSLYIVYDSTLGSLAALTFTQWKIARACSFIYRVSREMIWLQLASNVDIWSSGFNILWSIIQKVRASLVVLATENLLQTSPPQGLVGCCNPTPKSRL